MEHIRLLIVDDHEVVRTGLRATVSLEEDIEVVAEAEDAQSAVDQAASPRPDVVLMDVRLGKVDGIEACRRIREELPDVAVLMLTSFGDEETVVSAVLAGAVGYLLKNASVEDLLTAIRTINSGDAFICPVMTTKLVGDYVKRTDTSYGEDAHERLSVREREVLPLLAEGRANEEIASLLSVSPYTVQTYRQRIMKKLDLHSRTELLKYALRRGLISLD
ncbi:MAG: response regulator transcription factor [Chloroflexi bacterium]|nr:response regulator transcription factor [Chloroflexota bacterium]